MRKIYQSAPDVPQGIANKATDIIERHFAASGVRRADDLPEENKIHLLRELQRLFSTDLQVAMSRESEAGHIWSSQRGRGLASAALRWLARMLGSGEPR